jgi:hypothetical protein
MSCFVNSQLAGAHLPDGGGRDRPGGNGSERRQHAARTDGVCVCGIVPSVVISLGDLAHVARGFIRRVELQITPRPRNSSPYCATFTRRRTPT